MLIKEIKLKCERGINNKYIWTFKDKEGKKQILLVCKFIKTKRINNRIVYGHIVTPRLYKTDRNRGNREYMEFDIVSPIKADLAKFISGVGIVLSNSKLKLVVQYRPYPNIGTHESFDVHPILLQQLGLKLTCIE